MKKLLVVISVYMFTGLLTGQQVYWSVYELNIGRENRTAVVDLMDKWFSSDDYSSKANVALYQIHFTGADKDVTHELHFFSEDLSEMNKLYSGDYNPKFDLFLTKLNQLSDGKNAFTGKSLFRVDPKESNDHKFVAVWLLDVQDAAVYTTAFEKMVTKTKKLRSGHHFSFGTTLFGIEPGVNHYVLHTFESYKEMMQIMEKYTENKDFQDFVKTISPIRTMVYNITRNLVKRW